MPKLKPRRTKTIQVRVTPKMYRALKARANVAHFGVVSGVVLAELERLVGDTGESTGRVLERAGDGSLTLRDAA
jgi:hypothetical protein